jgi:rRNA maturation endonuclease Nob1
MVKVIEWDPKYSPRVDGRGKGADVIKGYRCRTCAKFEPLVGQPYDICWLCGGKMMNVGITFCGQDRVRVSRCQDCGKEYDTT